MRLFIALAPPAFVVADLDATLAPLRGTRRDLRWTSTEAWHVTLAFLGEVAEERLARLLPRMERAARRHPAFGLSFCGAGAFPSASRANVLWSGLAGDRRALAELAASVAAGARRAGAAPPDSARRYNPHLTLARCRAPVNVEQIVASLDGYAGPSWVAKEMYLIRSRLNGQPRFETLGTYDLRAPAPVVRNPASPQEPR
jgi:RNA 2',3'-cyclic 3'-phosphodiesterase